MPVGAVLVRLGNSAIFRHRTGNSKGEFAMTNDRDEAEHCLAILWHQVKELSAIARPLSQAFRLHFPEVPVQMDFLKEAA